MAWTGIFSRPPVPLEAVERRFPPWRNFPQAPAALRYIFRPAPTPSRSQQSAFQSQQYQLGYEVVSPVGLPRYPVLPVTTMPGSYRHGVIWYGIQQINNGRQIEPGSPLWSPGQVAALMGDLATLAKMTPYEAQGYGNPNARF